MEKPQDPKTRLRQSDVLSQLTTQGERPWTVVYESWRDDADNGAWFCCFTPPSARDRVLSTTSWDLTIGTGGPGFIQYYGPEATIEYLRHGTDDGTEPLVIIQDHHGIRPEMLPQLTEEFRLYHNLWTSPGGRELVKVNDDGTEEVVAEVSESSVRVRTKYLRQFQAGRQLDLVLFLDSVRYVDAPEGTIETGGVDVPDLPANVAVDLYIGDRVHGPERPFSRLCGKKVLPAPDRSKAGIWPFDERQEQYPEFIIGENGDGDELRFTCDHELLANYFGKNPGSPHYLTPVFFRREVLQRYYENPEKYSVSDGYLRCGGLWGLQIDNDHPDHVSVFLGDLGRDLPESERPYWLSFNVPPTGAISHTNYARSFLAIATDPSAPDLLFRSRYVRFNQLWREDQGWDLFKPLEPADEHVLQRLRIPLSNSQPELEAQVIGLTKLLVDSINEKEIGKRLLTKVENEKGLGKLERWLRSEGYPQVDRDLDFLRRLQRLRSKMAAHRKGSDYDRVLRNEAVDDDAATEVARMLVDARRVLHDLAGFYSIDLEPHR